ncbi:MAG: cupin domain-containing protein [Muribaculaceae bacterium]|nr:cupin domain-containing protein [Muribaculaceae bacterium]
MKTADIERNTPVKLKDQISLPDSGVKFEQICETKHGMALLIALKAGAKIDTHSVNAMALATVVEGSVNFTVEESVHPMGEHDTMVMAPGTPHSVEAVSDAKIYLVKINA